MCVCVCVCVFQKFAATHHGDFDGVADVQAIDVRLGHLLLRVQCVKKTRRLICVEINLRTKKKNT